MEVRRDQAVSSIVRAHSFKIWELTPWLAIAAVWFMLPAYLPFAAQILVHHARERRRVNLRAADLVLEEAALEIHSPVDSWQEEEPKHKRPGPSPLFSTEIAPRRGCSSEP